MSCNILFIKTATKGRQGIKLVANEGFVDEKAEEYFAKRLVSGFLDFIVLYHFQQEIFSAYDVTQLVNRRLNILLSPGTIYSTLYSMQREGLLESYNIPNKRVFKASEKGLKINKLIRTNADMVALITKIMQK